MNFDNFATVLIDAGLDVSVSKAKSLYTAMGADLAQVYSQNSVEDGEVIIEFGIQLALRTESILNSIHDGKKINAIKELRELARREWGIPMVLAQARDAVNDSRVLNRAMIPEWERALLGDNWDRPLIPKY